MKKRNLLLWVFLQVCIALAIAQPDTKTRISSLKVNMEEQLRALQEQALELKFPAASFGQIKKDAENEEKKIYGFLEFDEKTPEKGIVEFPLNNLQNYEFLYRTNGFTICAGAYANNRYYYYAYAIVMEHTLPLGFYEMDLESGETNMIKDYSSMSSLFGDMTYDYSTNTMWAYTETDDGPQLLTVDLATGEHKRVALIQKSLLALAADGNGFLYGITKAGELYSINKIDGAMTLIGSTGITPKYLQSMEFDRSNNVLYWAASTSADKGILATVDTKTGKATSLGTLGNNSQVLGLFIPYVPSVLKAPMPPAGLTVTTEGNTNKAFLEWTNPAKDVDGNDLEELLNIKIYREGTLIKTIENPVVGAKAEYQDTEVPTGLMSYSVTASNKVGESSGISVEKYIGRDVPAAPGNLAVVRLSDNAVRLSWRAPSTGLHGGWLDTSTLTYKVTRYPDEVVLTESTGEVTIEDTDITEYDNYYYVIQASNADGQGDMAMTEHISLGNPYTIPYTCRFDTEGGFNKWEVIDNNQDKITWNYYSGTAQYQANSYAGAGDDWLISPPVQVEKGESYRMSFDVVTGGFTEKLRVTFGKDATIGSQSVILDDSKYSSTDTVSKTVYFPHDMEKGNYRIGFYAHSDAGQWYIGVTNVRIEISEAGEIKGRVTSNDSPVSGCSVTVKETGTKVLTDAEGNYRIINVEAGEYNLEFSATGYEVLQKKVTVQKKTVSVADCALTPLPRHTVTGKITDEANRPLAGISVRIGGYADFEAITDAKGAFTIADVYKAEAYTFIIREDMYYYYSKPFAVADIDVDLGTVVLKEKVLPPYGVTAKEDNKNRLVTWQKPVAPKDFRLDDGNAAGKYSMTGLDDRAVCGVVYRTPALLNSVSWYLPETGNPNRDKVNIYIFDLDADGKPTSKIIYSVKDVPVRLEQWNMYSFPEEVYAPNGYMVAVGVDNGDISFGLDSGTLPFAENVQYMTYDKSDGFYALQSWDIENKNLMIRANGTPTAGMQSVEPVPAADSYIYKVWRFMEGNADDEASWTLLSSNPLAETTWTDTAWEELFQGIYRYAVKSVSKSGAVSVPSFSGAVYKDMFAAVTVNVTTNTEGRGADGAIVTLYNEDNTYTDTVRNNKPLLMNVWKGKYALKIILSGYVGLEDKDLDFSKQNSYETETYELREIIGKPYIISVGQTGNPGERLLSWDYGLFDNFELHPDFMINSPGLIGWTYIDGDESLTYGSSVFTFPGMGEKMAYVIMNYKETAEGDTAAYSGDKYLATFCSQSGRNNDFIVSPELKAEKDFKVSFYARSYEGAFGLETFRVGYSVAGTAMEDFVWIEGSKQNPPLVWTRYEFTVPAAAKYVTVNCISMNQHILMLDDIFIEAEAAQPVKNYYSYEVYLNGKPAGQTEDNSYLLQKLANGDYKASVRRVYSSGKSDFAELDFTVDDSGESIQSIESGIRIYPNPAVDCFYIEGEYTGVQVIDHTGKIVIDRDHSDGCVKVDKLSEGFYLIRIMNAKEVMIRKILVK